MAAAVKSRPSMMTGIMPFSFLPGRTESGAVGRPKKYLIGPAFVMIQETARVAIVASIRIIGKDPENVKLQMYKLL